MKGTQTFDQAQAATSYSWMWPPSRSCLRTPPTEDRAWKPIRPGVRRLELKAAVGPSPVVVGGVDPKDSLEVAAAQDQHPVQAFGPDRADPPLGERVRARGPDRRLDDLYPSERKTSSKGPGNFESRSRITKRIPSNRSPIARLRARWVTHAESGFLVTPRTCTRREPRWTANST